MRERERERERANKRGERKLYSSLLPIARIVNVMVRLKANIHMVHLMKHTT